MAPLEKEEAANNLIVGIAARGRKPRLLRKYPVYLATVDEGDLIAAGVRTPPFNVIVYSARGGDPEPLRLILDDALDFTSTVPARQPGRSTSRRHRACRYRACLGRALVAAHRQAVHACHEPAHLRAPDGHAAQGRARPSAAALWRTSLTAAQWVYNFNLGRVPPAHEHP